MTKNVAVRLESRDYEALLDLVGRSKGDLQNGLVAMIRERSAASKEASTVELAQVLAEAIRAWQLQDKRWKKVSEILRVED